MQNFLGALQTPDFAGNYIAIDQMQKRNALAQQDQALQQRQADNQNALAQAQMGQITRQNDIQDKAIQTQQRQQAEDWAVKGATILSNIKDPAQFSHVADAYANHPYAKALGITRDQITPENIQGILSQTQAQAGQLPFEQTPEYQKIQATTRADAANEAAKQKTEHGYRLGEIAAQGDQTRKTDAQKRADDLQPFGPTAGTPGAANGDAFLQTLPPNIAAQVKALKEGRMQFPGGMALKTPYWQNMLSAVSQYDPNFDAVNYNARAKTRADFTSGKNAQNIKSLNTAIGHLGALNEQIDDTASHSFTPLNYLQNAMTETGGSAGPTKFKQTAGALASELTQVFRGSGGAEADVKRYLSELNVNGSAEQKKAAVNNIVELLNSRLSAIGDQYNQGMGTTEDPLTLLNAKAQSVLQKIGGNGTGSKTLTYDPATGTFK